MNYRVVNRFKLLQILAISDMLAYQKKDDKCYCAILDSRFPTDHLVILSSDQIKNYPMSITQAEYDHLTMISEIFGPTEGVLNFMDTMDDYDPSSGAYHRERMDHATKSHITPPHKKLKQPKEE